MAIALDVMTAEKGYKIAVEGAKLAKKKYNIESILVGCEPVIKPYVDSRFPIEHATETIGMHERPTKALQRKNSTLMKCIELVLKGKADAFVEPGNTGATGAGARLNFKKFGHLKKTPILGMIPTEDPNKFNGLTDIGTNMDVNEKVLVQYAVLQSVYLEEIYKIKEPKIALLNVGVEDTKGGIVYEKAHEYLWELDKQGIISYAGNKEPYDIFNPEIDGFVCDGRTGNYILKSMEATEKYAKKIAKREFSKPINFILSLPGLLGMVLTYMGIKKATDSSNFSGAVVLGVDKVAVVTHGDADEKGIAEAIRRADFNSKQFKETFYILRSEHLLEMAHNSLFK